LQIACFALELLLGIGFVVSHNIDVLSKMFLRRSLDASLSLMVVSYGEEYLTFLEQVQDEPHLPAIT
jgi:hypothetical protein